MTAVTPQLLGRHVEHDERSRQFRAMGYPRRAASDVVWKHYGPVLDQNRQGPNRTPLGSCTGNAAAQCLNTAPYRSALHVYTNRRAVEFYSGATRCDTFYGEYPPVDAGSSGLGVAKYLNSKNLIHGYSHVFGLDHAKAAIQLGPFITGTKWLEGMFEPNADGSLNVTGGDVGGHEYLVVGRVNGRWWFLNSWSDRWGGKLPAARLHGGAFSMTDAEYGALLEDEGDATCFGR
jgi:hypothetical protein